MSDIQIIDTSTYVTVQGQFAVVNEGSGYAIINIQTKQVIARNITSFLDCVKTLEYICGNSKSQDSAPSSISVSTSEPAFSPKSAQKNYNYVIEEVTELDELDLAFVRDLAHYFEEMNGKIYRYHQDHHASREEADIIASYYRKATGIIKGVQTQNDLKELLQFLENLKKKVSRYQHNEDKYRWSTCLEKEVLVKLRNFINTL
jgi:hypothetical protein